MVRIQCASLWPLSRCQGEAKKRESPPHGWIVRCGLLGAVKSKGLDLEALSLSGELQGLVIGEQERSGL